MKSPRLPRLLIIFALASTAAPVVAENKPPQILEPVKPDYPEALRVAGIAGVVIVQFGVDATGKVENVSVFKSDHSELDAPAVEAIRKWKFSPGTKDGQPVAVPVLRIPITFAIPPTPFRSFKNFGEALHLAASEQKVVFVDFRTTWCEPCKRMDKDTWQNPAVIALLKEKAIAMEIDAEQATSLASHYEVTAYPTLLVLRPDGTIIDRLVGYRSAADFTEEFNSIVAGKTMLMAARGAVTNAGADPEKLADARYGLARELARQGNNAAALDEFTWCFDIGMKEAVSHGAVRLSFLLSDMANLAAQYPPALDWLKARRDQARGRITTDPVAATDFLAINHCLREDDATFAVFQGLPPDSAGRNSLAPWVFDSQVAEKHYDNAVAALPFSKFKRHFEEVRTKPKDDSQRAYLVDYAGNELEALAGAGKLDDARDVLKRLLDYDHSDATITAAEEHLKRAGQPDLMTPLPPAGKPAAAGASPAKL